MNYLVTHYKNLAEQLQSRINHLKQCLYEMDTGSYSSCSRKDMGPVNPPTHGGGLLPPQNPNLNLPSNRPGLLSPEEKPRGSNTPQYNPQDPWWSTNEGRMWQTYYSYWTVNAQNPNAWGTNNPSLPQFASANELIRYLSNQAQRAGVVPPWVYSPPNG